VLDVDDLVDPDCATVDALARLQLEAGRLGRRIVLRGASPVLRELIGLAGLGSVLPCLGGQSTAAAPGPASGVEPRGEPEEREQPRGVEEERDRGDPVA
jgi:hypothetical protein